MMISLVTRCAFRNEGGAGTVDGRHQENGKQSSWKIKGYVVDILKSGHSPFDWDCDTGTGAVITESPWCNIINTATIHYNIIRNLVKEV